MAALGWLLNLDFAGSPPNQITSSTVGNTRKLLMQRKRYGMGYRYAVLWGALWK